jgi:hypothetical protein
LQLFSKKIIIRPTHAHKVYGMLLNGFSEQEVLAFKHALEKIQLNARQ